jgi:DNA polymerase III alpha subunit
LEDSTNIIEAVIFSGEFEKHESKLQVGAPILITGSVEKDEENFKLIINSYNEVDSIRLISKISLPVTINLQKDLTKKETIELKELFDKFPNVTEWCDRISKRAAYSKMRPTEEQRFTSGSVN